MSVRVMRSAGFCVLLTADIEIWMVSIEGKQGVPGQGRLEGVVRWLKVRVLTTALFVVIGVVTPASVTQIASVMAGAPQEPRKIVIGPAGLVMVSELAETPEAGLVMAVASCTCR